MKKTKTRKARKPSIAAQLAALREEIAQLRKELAARPILVPYEIKPEPKIPNNEQWPQQFPDYPTFPPKNPWDENPWAPYIRD